MQDSVPAECFEYSSFSPLREQPGQAFSDGLSITDAYPVRYARLYVDLSHPDTSQLELELGVLIKQLIGLGILQTLSGGLVSVTRVL